MPFYEKVTFSYGKLGKDLARLVLLPLWVVLAVVGGCGQVVVRGWRWVCG